MFCIRFVTNILGLKFTQGVNFQQVLRVLLFAGDILIYIIEALFLASCLCRRPHRPRPCTESVSARLSSQCKHLLAIYLCEAVGGTLQESVSDQQMSALLSGTAAP